MAGGGERKTLRLVARYADACNLFPTPDLPHKLDVLREHCLTEGRDYASIEKSSMYTFGPGADEVDKGIQAIRSLANVGIEKVHVALRTAYDLKLLEVIAREIMPATAAGGTRTLR